MGAQWIDYKGKKILYVQYTGLKAPEMLGLIKTASEMIVAAKSNQVLSLTDVTDCFVNQEFLDLSKKQSAITLQYQSIGPDFPFSKICSGFRKYGRKKSRVSVKVEMVPKIHLTTANVSSAGNVTASPVKKLARQRANKDFLTRTV